MKKRSHVLPFATGMVTATLLFTCMTGALAAGEGVFFNTARVVLGAKVFAERGQSLQTAAGAEIPATILYTDSNGGGTLYAPVRLMMESIGAEVSWEAERNTASVVLDGSDNLYTMSSEFTGELTVDGFREIAPVVPTGGTALVPAIRHNSTENFTYEMPFDPAKGEYITVTVVNHAAKPIQFYWGITKGDNDSTVVVLPKQVPAGNTMVRTFQLVEQVESDSLYFDIGNVEGMCESCDFMVSVVQF